MNKQKAILILLLLIPLLFVLYFFGPFLIYALFDSSWYYSEEVDIGSLDYSSVLTNAEKSRGMSLMAGKISEVLLLCRT